MYEPYILQALAQWPEPVAINPAPLRPTTFSARLRDSIARLRAFHTITKIDMAVFDAMQHDLVVCHGDHTVTIGPRGKRGVRAVGQIQASQVTRGIYFKEGYDAGDIEACTRLLSKRLLSGPLFVYPAISEAAKSALEASYDVAITMKEDHTVIL